LGWWFASLLRVQLYRRFAAMVSTTTGLAATNLAQALTKTMMDISPPGAEGMIAMTTITKSILG